MGGDIRAMMYAFEVAVAAAGACVAFARSAWSMWNRYLKRERESASGRSKWKRRRRSSAAMAPLEWAWAWQDGIS